MILDRHLVWESHVSAVVKRCYACICGISKFSRQLTHNVKKRLIECLVFPHVYYCLTVWGGCSQAQRYRVQKVINHCARIVTGTRKFDHVTPVLTQLEWPKLDELLVERDIAAVHRILFAPIAPVALRTRLPYRSAVSSRSTRASDDQLLELPKVRTELARRSFAFRASQTWNTAPLETRRSVNFKTCISQVRKSFRPADVPV